MSVNHLPVQTKVDLKRALFTSLEEGVDCIIEVESCIEENATFHSTLKRSSLQAADNTLSSLLSLSVPDQISSDYLWGEIHKAEYSLYRIQLSAPPTSTRLSGNPSRIYKEGYLLAIYLEDGIIGFGEVAPLEIHKENLQDVEEQLRFLIHMIQGAKLSYLLPLLRGSFSCWIWECLGIQPHSLFPSVRCGLEMAVLNALAAKQGRSLAKLLHHQCSSSKVQICALLDSNATPKEVANVAVALVGEGFTTIKVKVGRRADAFEDATVIQEIRKKVGYQVKLRADANRMWTYKQASNFASSVQHCDLQYIEEPVNSEDDIVKFCEETGLPVALDETIDNIQGDPYGRLARFIHPGIVAVVIKPSVVGGFENASFIAKWAQKHDKMAVISSAFESSLGLASYVQFSHYLEQQNADVGKVKNKEPGESIAHGLGTFQWLKQDVTVEPLNIRGHPYNEMVEASLEDADRLLKNFKINPNVIQRKYTGEQVRKYQMPVDYEDMSCSFEVLEVGETKNNTVVAFLHGFLGTGEDWVPIMKALSTSTRCISFDLPGHGRSRIDKNPSMPIEAIASMVTKLIHNITADRVVLVGYSMGARIALYMALRCGNQVDGAVLISGSPGLKDEKARKRRVYQDNARAKSLKAHGLKFFLENWYSSELWRSLKAHPHFEKILSTRMQHNDVNALADTLQDLSVGRQPSLWDDLKQREKPLLFIYGENDEKFKKINQKMFDEVCENGEIHEIKEIPSSGHAVYLENPLSVINAITKFLLKLGDRLH